MRSIILCPYLKKETFGHRHTQGERRGKTGWSDTSTSQGLPKTAGSPQKPGRGKKGFSPAGFRGAGLCQHLDLGPLASRTETINFCWLSGAVEAGKPRHSGRSQRWDIAPNVGVLSGGFVFSLPSSLSPQATWHDLLSASPINARAGPPASRKLLEHSILSGHQWRMCEPCTPASICFLIQVCPVWTVS